MLKHQPPIRANFLNPRLLKVGAAACLVMAVASFVPAFADDSDAPFALQEQAWGPVKSVKPADAPVGPAEAAIKPADAQPNIADQPPPAPVAVYRSSAAPALIDAGHGYQLQIKSTAAEPAHEANGGGEQVSAAPSEQNWQSAAEAARRAAIANGETVDEQGVDHRPLAIRLSFLPDPAVAPKEPGETPSHKRPKNLAPMTLKAPVTAATPQVNQADLAAVAAYRKNQLDALQGDRETLTNLQKAIATLGLNKQLDFLTTTDAAHSAAVSPLPGTKGKAGLP